MKTPESRLHRIAAHVAAETNRQMARLDGFRRKIVGRMDAGDERSVFRTLKDLDDIDNMQGMLRYGSWEKPAGKTRLGFKEEK